MERVDEKAETGAPPAGCTAFKLLLLPLDPPASAKALAHEPPPPPPPPSLAVPDGRCEGPETNMELPESSDMTLPKAPELAASPFPPPPRLPAPAVVAAAAAVAEQNSC